MACCMLHLLGGDIDLAVVNLHAAAGAGAQGRQMVNNSWPHMLSALPSIDNSHPCQSIAGRSCERWCIFESACRFGCCH